MRLIVRCDKCRQKQKYYSKGFPYKKRKRCVYCGKTFIIRNDKINNIVERLDGRYVEAKLGRY